MCVRENFPAGICFQAIIVLSNVVSIQCFFYPMLFLSNDWFYFQLVTFSLNFDQSNAFQLVFCSYLKKKHIR